MAVIEGRWSGSGKLVYDKWDTLPKIWSGSPAATAIDIPINEIFSDDEDNENNDLDKGEMTQGIDTSENSD